MSADTGLLFHVERLPMLYTSIDTGSVGVRATKYCTDACTLLVLMRAVTQGAPQFQRRLTGGGVGT